MDIATKVTKRSTKGSHDFNLPTNISNISGHTPKNNSMNFHSSNAYKLTSLGFHQFHTQPYNAFSVAPKSARMPGFMVTSRKVEKEGLDKLINVLEGIYDMEK